MNPDTKRTLKLTFAVLCLLLAGVLIIRALIGGSAEVDPAAARRGAEIESQLREAAPDSPADPEPSPPAAPAGRTPRAPQ